MPEADALEQQLAARPGAVDSPTRVGDREANEADVLEQEADVPLDEDDRPDLRAPTASYRQAATRRQVDIGAGAARASSAVRRRGRTSTSRTARASADPLACTIDRCFCARVSAV